MSVSATVYNVLYSCPNDVVFLKDKIQDTINEFNETIGNQNQIFLMLRHWKDSSYPRTGEAGQDTLNKEFINDCDLAIAVFWTQFGHPTEKYGSGTEEEIMNMLKANKQVFLYFFDKEVKPSEVLSDSTKQKEYQKILKLKKDFEEKKYGLHGGSFSSEDIFKQNLLIHLQKYFIDELKSEKKKFENEQLITPFIKWENQKEPSNLHDTFFTNDYIEEKKTEIKNNKCLRITGQSGVGKTRIVYEAFRDSHDNYLYCNSNNTVKEKLLQTVDELSKGKKEYTFVIDNCDDDLFSKLYKIQESYGFNTQIITITHDATDIEKENLVKINISITKLESIIEQILQKEAKDYDESKTSRIKEFSAGNPLMAKLLIKSLRENRQFGFLNDTEIINSIIGNDNENKEIMKSCSIFKNIGYKGTQEAQIKFIIDSRNFTPGINGDNEYKEDKFYKLFEKMKSLEVFECYGDYFTIRPTPISLHLGEEWYKNCNENRLTKCLNELDQCNNSILIDAFCNQFILLGRDKKTKDLIKLILKPTGPFGNAKVLLTNTGSQLFRSFVEVNPEATVETLFKVISDIELSEIYNISGSVRRNIIWTLEKGCFYDPTFEKASKILLKFALAENETYGNNATNQFIRLFSVYLPGTEANFSSRLALLNYCLTNPDSREIGFKSIERCLQLDNVYFGGAEKFGTESLQHYTPNTNEIIQYWNTVLTILKDEISNKGQYEDFSYLILAHSTRSLYRYGFFQVIYPYITQIVDSGKTNWDEMLDSLCLIRDYDLEKCNYFVDEIKTLIKKLQKQDLVSRFKLISDYKRNRKLLDIKAENSLNYFKQEYSKLAEEFINEKKPIEIIKDIFKANSNYCIGFGSRLAELLLDDSVKTKQIIDIGIEYLNSTEKFSRLFVDFAKKIDDENLKYLRDQLICNKNLSEYLFSIYGERNTKLSNIQDLYSIADKFPENAFFFKDYWFNIPFINWDSDKEMSEHFIKLSKYGTPGINAILYVVFEFRSYDMTKYSKTLQTISEILSTYSLFKKEIDKTFLISAIEYLLQKTNNPQLAIHVNKEFLKYISIPENIHTDVAYYKSLYEILLKNYFNNIWEDLLIGIKSEGDKILVYLKLKQLLGAEIDTDHIADKGLLFDAISIQDIENNLNNDSLLQIRIMEIAPVFQDKIHFSNTVLYMLKKYGNNKKMLTSLVSSMNSFAWTGSLVPYYETCRNCFVSISNESDYSSIAYWINDLITKYSEAIDQEKKRDEEAKLLYE